MAREDPTNRSLAEALELLGDLLELEGAVRHRVLAYRRAGARIRSVNASVAAMARAGRAIDLPDIGPTIQAKVVELADTGAIAALEAARQRTPEGLVAVARLRGIGPRKAMAFWRELGIGDLGELAEAAAAGRLRELPGVGPTTEGAILEQLAAGASEGGEDGGAAPRVSLGIALPLAEDLACDLAAAVPGARVAVAGSLRRGVEAVRDIDLVGAGPEPERLHAALAAHPAVERALAGGAVRSAVALHAGLRVELLTGRPEAFGNLLQHATGSAAHNVRLREHALRRGLSVSEHGLSGPDGAVRTHADEAALYADLGLATIPPELREDAGELERAAAGPLPPLVRREDLRGDLHMHTDWSDGRESLTAMVAAARARGYAYLAISDHSQSLSMTGGLDPERVRRQWEAIDALNATDPGIRVLKGTEMDILRDGRLDFDDALLEGFDWVTASLHSGFAQGAPQITARLLSAIECPHVDVIGHPTGRMMGRRPHAGLDLDRVLEAAARTGTFLEVNSQPRRLDLDDRMAREALAAGVRLTIGSDAHGSAGLDLVRLGVAVARRAGAGPGAIGNTRPWEELASLRPQ